MLESCESKRWRLGRCDERVAAAAGAEIACRAPQWLGDPTVLWTGGHRSRRCPVRNLYNVTVAMAFPPSPLLGKMTPKRRSLPRDNFLSGNEAFRVLVYGLVVGLFVCFSVFGMDFVLVWLGPGRRLVLFLNSRLTI